ncbi:uncharacterized protein V6R79_013414 [Siganus canaliculatus]
MKSHQQQQRQRRQRRRRQRQRQRRSDKSTCPPLKTPAAAALLSLRGIFLSVKMSSSVRSTADSGGEEQRRRRSAADVRGSARLQDPKISAGSGSPAAAPRVPQ